MQLNITEEESLWVSLHDGILESLTSDRLARSVVLVIDVPYIWEFHAKPDTTRFHVLLEGVRKEGGFVYTHSIVMNSASRTVREVRMKRPL